MSDYAKVLKKVLDSASVAQGMSRVELEAEIASITEQLKHPVGDGMRIILCGERASCRQALAVLSAHQPNNPAPSRKP